jgi:hypothetical protein
MRMRAPLPILALAALAATGAAQPKAGEWRPLFDGKSLEGWRETPFADRGNVRVENGVIVLGTGHLTGITWTGSFPKSDFEVRFEAQRVDGHDFFSGLTFPVGDSYCTWIVGGWGGGVVGLSNVDGWDASENPTNQWREFEDRRWYALRLRVTSERIQAWIDNEQFVDLPLEGRTIDLRYGEMKLSVPLGFASYGTTAALRKLEYRVLPPAAAAK